MRGAAAATFAVMLSACTHVGSSAYRTSPEPDPTSGQASTNAVQDPAAEAVVISATRDPAAARELGVVEAHGRRPIATLEAIVAEFRTRVAALGGDYGRIDSVETKHELVTETYTYDCGTTETSHQTRSVYRPGPNGTGSYSTETVPVTRHVPKTCSGRRQVEAATLTIVGRAFRTSRGAP